MSFRSPSSRTTMALVATVAALAVSCAQTPKTVPGPPPYSEAQVILVPLGDVGPNDLNALAAHYRATLGLAVAVGPAVAVDHGLYDPYRRQYIAESLMQRVKARVRPIAANSSARFIAVTHEPMYSEADGRPISFAYRGGDRFAIVSSGYMDTTSMGRESSPEQVAVRARKTVSKTIGVLHYGLPLSRDPKSVLYGGIFRPEDIDRVDERTLEKAIDARP